MTECLAQFVRRSINLIPPYRREADAGAGAAEADAGVEGGEADSEANVDSGAEQKADESE